MNDIDATREVMSRIADLLRGANEHAWAATMDRHREQLRVETAEARYQITRLFGGMGSISDVVLYRDGHLLTHENNELHQLLSTLYSHCTQTRSP
jgi:hypothetical protein